MAGYMQGLIFFWGGGGGHCSFVFEGARHQMGIMAKKLNTQKWQNIKIEVVYAH